MSNVPRRYLTVTEAIAYLAELGIEVTGQTLRNWAQDGKVPAIKLPSGQYRFTAEGLDGILDTPAGRSSERVA